MKKTISKILNIVSSVILGLVAITVILAVIENKTGADILPFKVMYVTTGSMEPEIPTKSYILVVKTKNVKKGDVISFISTDDEIYGEINTHRITDVLSDGSFETKGDANIGYDKTSVTSDRIIGKRVMNLPIITFFGHFLQTIYGLIFVLVFIMITFGIASGLIKIKTKKQAKEEEIRRLIDEEVKRLEEEAKNK